jgi:hypothetical protein
MGRGLPNQLSGRRRLTRLAADIEEPHFEDLPEGSVRDCCRMSLDELLEPYSHRGRGGTRRLPH